MNHIIKTQIKSKSLITFSVDGEMMFAIKKTTKH